MPKFLTPISLPQLSSPAAPASGYTALSARSGDLLYSEDSSGTERLLAAGPAPVRLSSTQSTTSTSISDVSGMGLSVEAGRSYHFRFTGQYTAATSGVGLGLALNGPTLGSDGLTGNVMIGLDAPVSHIGTITAYNTAVLATSSSGSTRMPWELWGYIHVSASGTLQLRFRSEVNGSAVNLQVGTVGFAWVVG